MHSCAEGRTRYACIAVLQDMATAYDGPMSEDEYIAAAIDDARFRICDVFASLVKRAAKSVKDGDEESAQRSGTKKVRMGFWMKRSWQRMRDCE